MPLNLFKILIKLKNFVKYTLKIRKINHGIRETEKMYDIVYFFDVVVGETDFNTQKPVSEKKLS